MKGLTLHSDVGIDYSWYNFRIFIPDYAYHSTFVNVSNYVAQGNGYHLASLFGDG